MSFLTRLLPRALITRVYALYSLTFLIFVGGSLYLLYRYQSNEMIEEAQGSAIMLAEVMARTYYESQDKPTYVIREVRETPDLAAVR